MGIELSTKTLLAMDLGDVLTLQSESRAQISGPSAGAFAALVHFDWSKRSRGNGLRTS